MIEKYVNAHIVPIDPEDIPEAAANRIINQGSLYINRDDAPTTIGDFGGHGLVRYETGDVGYIAEQTKTYGHGEKEEVIHLVDTTHDGAIKGYGEIRFNKESSEDYFHDKPFVGTTRTEEEYRGEGLARRRLLVMNLVTVARLGLALHSDTLIAHEHALRTWERLVREERAMKYDQQLKAGKQTPRFRFHLPQVS